MKLSLPLQLSFISLLVAGLYIGTQIPVNETNLQGISLCSLKPQQVGKVKAQINSIQPLPLSPNQVAIQLNQQGCTASLILPAGQARQWTLNSTVSFIATSTSTTQLSNPQNVVISNSPETVQTFNLSPITLIPSNDDYLIRVSNGYREPIVLTIKKELSSLIRKDVSNSLTATMTSPTSGTVTLVNNRSY